MTFDYLMNEVKKANAGFIIITLHLDDPSKPGEPTAKHYASQNLDYDSVTKLLEHSVKERKKAAKKEAAANRKTLKKANPNV